MTAELHFSTVGRPHFARSGRRGLALRGAMPASENYHEALWEAVPEGLEPVDFARRSGFLLGHVRAGERVLDVGCGEGRFAAELARAGTEVVGIDVAAEPLRRARERHPELDLRQISAAGAWPLQDASFDMVWAGEVIEHVADTAGWLSEVRRVLRSGGTLLLSTPDHGRLRDAPLGARATRLRGPLRSPRRSPALLHAPHAQRAARGLRLSRRRSAARRRAARRAASAAGERTTVTLLIAVGECTSPLVAVGERAPATCLTGTTAVWRRAWR